MLKFNFVVLTPETVASTNVICVKHVLQARGRGIDWGMEGKGRKTLPVTEELERECDMASALCKRPITSNSPPGSGVQPPIRPIMISHHSARL